MFGSFAEEPTSTKIHSISSQLMMAQGLMPMELAPLWILVHQESMTNSNWGNLELG